MAQIMAIVNLTPDSFYAPSRVPIKPSSSCPSPDPSSPTCSGISSAADIAVERILSFFRAGASIVDLGAVSTRPGAAFVSARTEWRRLAPVLRALVAHPFWGRSQEVLVKVEGAFGEGPKKEAGPSPVNVPPSYLQTILGGEGLQQKIGPSPNRLGTIPIAISIDTTRASIVRKAYKVIGPFIVNDISAGEDDPQMLPTVAELGLPYIAMHKRGNPQTMNDLCDYPDGVMAELVRYFTDFAERAAALGIRDWILDPGLGFAKTAAQNWEILEHLEELKVFGRPILIGTADKRFTKEVPEHILEAYSEGMPEQVGHDGRQVGHDVRQVGHDEKFVGHDENIVVRDGRTVIPVSTGNLGHDVPDGTAIADALAVAHGADILRVHRIP